MNPASRSAQSTLGEPLPASEAKPATPSMPGGQRRYLGWVVFAALPFAYFLSYGLRGFSDTDHGYLSGIAWRVTQGQLPYLDFIYVRPPLSPYLHAGILAMMPENLWVIGERFLFFLAFWVGTILNLELLRKHWGLQRAHIPYAMLGCLAFVFSVNNCAPYPWYTLDGLLLSNIGIYCVARGRGFPTVLLGFLFLCAAASCKQSYFPMLPVGLCLCFILHGKRATLYAATTLATLIATVLFTAYEWQPELVSRGYRQMSLAGSFDALLDAGLFEYTEAALYGVPFAIVALTLQRRWGLLRAAPWIGWGWWGTLWVLVSLNLWRAMEIQGWSKATYSYGQFAFALALITAVSEYRRDRQRATVLLSLLAVAWCGGISWGTQTPILSATPILFGAIVFLRERVLFRPPTWAYSALLLGFSMLFLPLSRYTYRDDYYSRCTYRAAEVFPRFSGLSIGADNYSQYEEFKALVGRYGTNFAVLPAMPLAHFLTDTNPTIPIDWALNAELNYEYWRPQVLEALNRQRPFIFVQKRGLKSLERIGHRYDSWITRYVRDHWQLVEKSPQFLIYRHPEGASKPR